MEQTWWTFIALVIIMFFALFKFIRPAEKKIFNINNPFGEKILTRLRSGFSHLCEHKLRSGFKDTFTF